MRIHELFEVSAADSFNNALKGSGTSSTGPLTALKKGIKTGYKDTKKSINNFPYSKTGKMFRNIAQFTKDVNRAPKR